MRQIIFTFLSIFILTSGYTYAHVQASDTARVHYEQGLKNYKDGNYKDAINAFSRSIIMDRLEMGHGPSSVVPEALKAYYYRGFSKYHLTDYKNAVTDFNIVIRINPEYIKAYFYRGLTKHKLNNPKGAIKDFNKALEIDPDYAKAYYGRGLTILHAVLTGVIAADQKENACNDLKKAGELGYTKAYDAIRYFCN